MLWTLSWRRACRFRASFSEPASHKLAANALGEKAEGVFEVNARPLRCRLD
jgi:hypothetical protein